MITPEEVREYLKKYYPNKYLLEFVTQQEKKDRLLGLYRTARKQVEEYNDAPNKNPRVLHLALDIHETLEDIDKLEKMLEEMK